jgi:hypothetical protein
MIDDLEDGDASILMREGRVGAWYTYTDGTAGGMLTYPVGMAFVPAAGGNAGSRYAARLAYAGFSTWGAGMGFNLNDPGDGAGGSNKHQYNAGAYTGLTFFAKAASPMKLRVNMPDGDTDPAGGKCTTGCSDDFGGDLSLTADWQPFTIEFAAATQVGWSGVTLPAIDPSSLYAVHFQAGPGSFDFWIDDVAFLQ